MINQSGKDRRKINIETKSRYEVIAELEQQKNALIRERESFKDKMQLMERELRDAKRQVDDAEEELKQFKENVEEKKALIEELIKAKDESLKRFSSMQFDKKK